MSRTLDFKLAALQTAGNVFYRLFETTAVAGAHISRALHRLEDKLLDWEDDVVQKRDCIAGEAVAAEEAELPANVEAKEQAVENARRALSDAEWELFLAEETRHNFNAYDRKYKLLHRIK